MATGKLLPVLPVVPEKVLRPFTVKESYCLFSSFNFIMQKASD